MQVQQIKREIESAAERFYVSGIEEELSVCVHPTVGGYYVRVSIGDSIKTVISSQRADQRVFKTLDGLRKILKANQMHSFRVMG